MLVQRWLHWWHCCWELGARPWFRPDPVFLIADNIAAVLGMQTWDVYARLKHDAFQQRLAHFHTQIERAGYDASDVLTAMARLVQWDIRS